MSTVTQDTEAVDDFLAHYGVRGMKWGQRKAHAKNMRALDKAARKEDKAKRADEIEGARNRTNSGQNQAAVKAAKAEYKANKNVVGKVAAKRALNEARDKRFEDYNKSKEYKNGKELATAIAIGLAGSVLLASLSKS